MSGVLHFGASMKASGRLSQKPDGKYTFKVLMMIEKLVRFDIAKIQGRSLLTDRDIARVLGRAVRSLEYYRTTIPYLKKRIELTTGIATDTQEQVENSINIHKQQLKSMLPASLRTIFDVLQTPTDVHTTLAEKKFRVEVARDILDREGSFPRISRTDSHVKHEHDFGSLDGVSKELLSSIDVSSQTQETDNKVRQLIEISKQFSQTETLSAPDMERSLAELERMPTRGVM